MTYPEQAVAETISANFVPVQINTQEESGKPIVQRFRQIWTPDLRVLAPDGYELYRWNGYLPPYEFLPQLLAAQAHAYLRMNELERAAGLYDEVVRRFSTSACAPEAQYYGTVARYKASHESSDLMRGWQRLQDRYPNSIWRLKQSFTEQG